MSQLKVLPGKPMPVLRHDPVMLELQEQGPVVRVRTPSGDPAWLVTRHAEVKRLLSDPRLGRSHPDPPNAPRYSDHPILGSSDLFEFDTEPVDHAQMRRLLTPYFSAKRMRELAPSVQSVADKVLDAVEAKGPPADLHTEFSLPFSVRVLCELLGVSYADREHFQYLVTRMRYLDGAETGQEQLLAYMRHLAARKRKQPGDDMISGLCAAGLSDVEVAGLATMVFFAGHDSIAVNIDLGLVLVLTGHREAILRDVDTAVEEILRAAERDGPGLPRYAREDLEVCGQTIRAGDLVFLDFTLANFDKSVFPDPIEFDPNRKPNPHLAFAHGRWHCLGAPLARLELRIVFTTLLERFPQLRLAIPADQLMLSDDQFASSIVELPVTW